MALGCTISLTAMGALLALAAAATVPRRTGGETIDLASGDAALRIDPLTGSYNVTRACAVWLRSAPPYGLGR
jgi:hypothetical protein